MSRAGNTQKALKNKKSSKRFKYKLYKNNLFLGIYDRKELEDLIGLKSKDFYKETSNKKQLLLQGYKWNLESVEDSAKVSYHYCFCDESN